MKKKPPLPLAEQLRAAIRRSGLTHYALAKQSGVPAPRIHDFTAGNDMRLTNAGKLAEALGLELREKAG